jgi:hypothetical protein
MTENATFYVKYKEFRAVGIDTHFKDNGDPWGLPITSVDRLIDAVKAKLTPLLNSYSIAQLTLHSSEGNPLDVDENLTELGDAGKTAGKALVVETLQRNQSILKLIRPYSSNLYE